MMFPVYRDRAVQPGTAMTAHGDEVRCRTGAGPFFPSRASSAHRAGDPHRLSRSKSTWTLPHPPETATRLFVYQNALIPTGGITGGNTFSGGQAYATFLNGPVSTFFPQFTADNFSVSGTVVPEPSSLMVLVISLLGFGVLRRYCKNG